MLRPTGCQHPVITNWVENVPVRGLAGEIIGRARVSNKGEIQISIDVTDMAKETYDKLVFLPHLYDGLVLAPNVVPTQPEQYSDEVKRRLAEKNPFNKEGAH